MDKEIIYINNILTSSDKGLKTGDISKLIFEKYNLKVSKTIVKNYLWSYFRHLIKYDSSNYTYKLNNDQFLLDDIDVKEISNTPRAINVNFEGSRIKVEYDKNIPTDDYIKALAIVNYKSGSSNKNVDMIKQINRIIEQINETDD